MEFDEFGNPIELESQLDGQEEELNKPEPLPEDLDLKKYGLPDKDEYEKLKSDLETANARLKETQTSYHDNQSRLGQEMAAIKTQIANLSQRPAENIQSGHGAPMKDSEKILQMYQQNPQNANLLPQYYQALARENVQPHIESLNKTIENRFQQMDQSSYIMADRNSYMADPNFRDLSPNEVEAAFDLQTGGKNQDYRESALVVRARRAGGIQAYEESLLRKGEARYLERLKSKGNGNSITVIPGSKRTQATPRTQESDWNSMSDDEFDKEAEAHFQKTGIDLRVKKLF